MRASSPRVDRWRARGRTLVAGLLLIGARLLIVLVPLRFWRGRLGLAAPIGTPGDRSPRALRLARHVERAAALLPFGAKCLPRAMALSLLLRRAGIAHEVAFAVRPRGHRDPDGRLHAWVRRGDTILIGDEPGPWVEILAFGRR